MTVKPPIGPDKPDMAASTSAPDPAAFADAHRRLLADDSIQFQMDPFTPPDPPDVPDWSGPLGGFIGAIWPVVEILFWAVVAVAVLYILYALFQRFSGADWPWRRPKTEAPDDSWRPDEAPARQLLSEADALAARGLYSEAAHLLLFRSIEDIDQRRPELVRPALTSRDIAALPAIPARPRGAFARIAAMVERSFFARRPLVETDWRDCRAAYEDFAFAEGWRG